MRGRGATRELRYKYQHRAPREPQGPGVSDVRSSIEDTLAFFDQHIDEIDAQIRSLIGDDPTLRGQRELLTSIHGIGERLAVTILGELPNLSEFRNAKALSAFVGLCPREFRSGTSISRSWLAKSGNSHIRYMLYMPAVCAIRCKPIGYALPVSAESRSSQRSCVACWCWPTVSSSLVSPSTRKSRLGDVHTSHQLALDVEHGIQPIVMVTASSG